MTPKWLLGSLLVSSLYLAASLPAPAARPWPDTTAIISVFADQLPESMTEAQRQFAATHLAGTQKMRRSQIDALRAYNPDFLCLHYQLGIGCGAHNFIVGDTWTSDWDTVNSQANWFFYTPAAQRVHQTLWNWDVMNVLYTNATPNTTFPQYWTTTVLARITAAQDDGVFADSFTPDGYIFGQCSPSHPWFEDIDECLNNWVPNLETYGRQIRAAFEADTNGYLFLPNIGGLVTGWLEMDYGLGHGGMIEGFAFWGPDNPFDAPDWQLQMNRALALVRSNKVLICQSYAGNTNYTERLFALGSYLLIKGTRTYINIMTLGDDVATEYYPEYTINLGAPLAGPAGSLDDLWNAGWGVYRRDFSNGVVLVNPGADVVAIPALGTSYWNLAASGGGAVDAFGDYGGVLSSALVTSVTLPERSSAVLLKAGAAPGVDTNVPPQPTGLAARHSSGQTFITWTERADLAGESYKIYRHTAPITAANRGQAALLYQVWEDSGRFYANRYDDNGTWRNRYCDRLVITNNGAPLAADVGLLAWTLATNDFAGAAGGNGYYAVATVNSLGVENTGAFTSANSLGPVAEAVAEPLPVHLTNNIGVGGHVYIQYMDLRIWNPTFHAPRAWNAYYGLVPGTPAIDHAIAYAHDYTVYEPECADSSAPATLIPHGWGGNTYGPPTEDPDPWGWCTYKIYPVDMNETWHYGFARHHDFRLGGEVPAGDEIVNYTEYRELRMLRDLMRQPPDQAVDPNRCYVYGHSMGGSATLAMALRYPNVFAAAYASEPMTDYAIAGTQGGQSWLSDLEPKWGSVARNLPVRTLAPANWADALQKYNGLGVWTWQNHQSNLLWRVGDEMVPLGLGHGTNDMVIEWPTQARPVYAKFNAARRCWGGVVNNLDHTWLAFEGLPPNLAGAPAFYGFTVVRDESVPGLSNLSTDPAYPPVAISLYNNTLEWSCSWNNFDGAVVDTPTRYEIVLRSQTVAGTVDVTPRRLQRFPRQAGASAQWRNLALPGSNQVQNGVIVADAKGLFTIPAAQVGTAGNRLVLELATNNLPAPASVTVVSTGDLTRVQVSWSAVPEAVDYEVWHSTDGNLVSAVLLAGHVAATSYEQTSANPGLTYYYWVRAVNAEGWGAFSTRAERRGLTGKGLPWLWLLL